MKKLLVGSTGFVGSNLIEKAKFDGQYNSKNIEEAYGLAPDLLVYSGVPAQKFLANKNPEEDFQIIQNAITNIEKIQPKKIVLISTIDIYPNPVNVNEDSKINQENLQPYGKNRYYLEEWVKNNFQDYLIVRLPGLYGKNIKKNFIYDLIHVIPSLLTEEKYQELVEKDDFIKAYYTKLENGFYKCQELSDSQRKQVKQYFEKIGFSALNFTDSRGIFQFYNLSYLWEHITIALQNQIKILNLATEPVTIQEVYQYIKGHEFVNEITNTIPNYQFQTKYDSIFQGKNGYIFNKEFVLQDIRKFVEDSIQDNIKLAISNIAWNEEKNEQLYRYLKSKRITGLEIAPTKIIPKDPYDHLTLAKQIGIDFLEKYNLSICSMQSIWYGKTENIFDSEEAYQTLKEYTYKAIDFANSINCSNLVFGCPKNRNMKDYEKDYQKAKQFFREVGEYAQKKQVIIAIEPNPTIYNTNFLNTTEEALNFVKDVNLKNIQINYDLGTVIYNQEDLQILKENIAYVNHIHISEPNLELIQKRELHKELINILKDTNYCKFISIEMKNQENIEDIIQTVEYINSLINERKDDSVV